MANLYPEPPHLTIAVYPDQPEKDCFASLCKVAERFGCEPGGTVEVAPWNAAFELRSDLAGKSSILKTKRDRFDRVVAGSDDAGRPVRAGYQRKGSGVVLVEYLAAPAGDRHPIAISVSAQSLGIPVELWRKSERSSAAKLASWATDLLSEATAQCRVLYGAIGIEYSLATPSELVNSVASLPSEVFVSRDLVESNPEVRTALSHDFQGGYFSDWPTGWFYSGWSPFNAQNRTMPAAQIPPKQAGVVLGRAALNR